MAALALIGSGYMARTHATALLQMKDVTVRYVVSRERRHAMDLARRLGAVPSNDLALALRDPSIDAVDVCTPTDLHREIVAAAFDAGKHVFVEKPLALSLADADSMIRAAERADRILMVGLVLRHWPEYARAFELVESGSLGEPRSISAHRLSSPANWNTWMSDRARSGGVAVDMMCHDFDVACRILGEPLSVHAHRVGDTEHMAALVEHRRGRAVIEGSLAMPPSFPFSSSLRVGCEGGTLEYLFRASDAEEGGNIGDAFPSAGLVKYPLAGEIESIVTSSSDAYAAQLRYFLECLKIGKVPLEGTAQQARTVLAVSLAANRSAEIGHPVPVDA